MVNNPNPRILAAADCKLRPAANGRTKIRNGPIYDLNVVKQLVVAFPLVVINTDGQEDMKLEFTPKLTMAELQTLILALRPELYDDSECCKTSVGMTVDCDGYAIWWNRNREIESREFGRKIYVKFGFRDRNPRCIVVSIHPSNR